MSLATREPSQSRHWLDILWRIADGALRDEDLIGIAAHYTEPGSEGLRPISRRELQDHGFAARSLNVAFGRERPIAAEPAPVDLARLVATSLRRFRVEDERSNELILDGDRLRFIPRENPP
jgi:hypothetical protein